MSAAPTFSVIVPTFNRADTFLRAISSVVHQTFQDFELIVVDDGSDKNYAEAICSTLSVPWRVIQNSANLGAAGSRNCGIRAARGKYVSLLDDDDEFHRSFLESTFRILEKSSDNIGLSWCSVYLIDYPRSPEESFAFWSRKFEAEYADKSVLFEKFISIGASNGLTIKRSCIDKVGMFDTRYKVVEDTDFFLRILENGFLPVVISETLFTVHRHCKEKLTGARHFRTRLSECHSLLSQHAEFLNEFQNIRIQLENLVEFLEKSIREDEMQAISN